MNEDQKELIEYLDQKFNKIDERFAGIDQRFFEIENKLDNKVDKSDFNELLTSVDAYAKKADDYFQEMTMLTHQVNRHETWHQQAAVKLGIKLDF